jgi:uncharacterized membrane protein YdjX (TVP38/TMEM64 family)
MNTTRRFSNPTIKFIIFIILAIVFLSLGKIFSFDTEPYRDYLSQFPLLLSGAIFIVLYCSLSFIIWIGPKDIFKIVGVAIYGPYLSTFLIWIAEMGNLLFLFSLSRRLGRAFVENKLKGRMHRVDQAIAETSYWWIIFLRSTPIVPFRFQDLGFGLTKISLRKYFTISALASPPRIFFLQFFLSLGLETIEDPRRLTAYLEAHPKIFLITFVYLLISLILLFVLRKRLKRE